MGRPFAAFDIDGTVIRWQLYHAIGDGMAKKGIIEASEFERVRRARMNWKRREGEDAFHDYEQALVSVFNKALVGLPVATLKEVIGSAFDEYKEQVYIYTRGLIEELKNKDYLLFAISGSQIEIVQLLAVYYGFDDFGGSTYEIVNGKFTGKNEPLRRNQKPEYLRELVEKHNADWHDSIAVGDSESDIPMLETVEQPIAFNPSKQLFVHATKAGWKVVLERKNMVYQLEPRDGSYLLAQTNT